LAKELLDQEKILIAEVTIMGQGSPINNDLELRFGLSLGILPELILFQRKKLPGKPLDFDVTRFGDRMELDHMRRFLQCNCRS
jgi:hypothetical protein